VEELSFFGACEKEWSSMNRAQDGNTLDLEAIETREWLESLDYVLKDGRERASHLLQQLQRHAGQAGVKLPFSANTPYVNTISAQEQAPFPGNQEIERRIKSLVRWNALAMVVRANRLESGIGGHISTYASAATLYEVAFNHFFRARSDQHEGDFVYFQGHATPGIYARAFLEGRLTVQQLENFRRELRPPPLVDARFLAIPHRLYGLGPDYGHLPRPLHPLSGRPRLEEALRFQDLGLSGRRRDR
jgi:pyruvate dehydrogenase complex dehydrogenase (E1) component